MPEIAADLDVIADLARHGVGIHLAQRTGPVLRRRREPVTFGVPLPRGAAGPSDVFSLQDSDGRAVPADTTVLDRWGDGSIRWLLVDGQVDADPLHTAPYRLVRGNVRSLPRLHPIVTTDKVVIAGERLRFELQTGSASPFNEVLVDGRPAIDAAHTAITVLNAEKEPCVVRIERVRIEQANNVRVAVAAEGTVRTGKGRRPLLELLLRLHFFADCPTVRMLLRVRNPRRAKHPNGYWDLGSGGSVYIEDLSLTLALARSKSGTQILCSPEPTLPYEGVDGPLTVYQDSSGGENWQSSNHVNRHRVVPNSFRGYLLRAGNDTREGLRATPVVALRRGGACLAATMPHFWQNFPKTIEATDDALTVGLFPGQYADVHEIQGGEQKTHEVFVSFALDGVTDEPLAWCRSRLVPHAEPRWYCDSGAVPYLTPATSTADRGRVVLINAAIEGGDTFDRKRETIDEYGWRHFGEIYGDHEAVGHQGKLPLVSHYNNQYDPIAGFASQFVRSGDVRWWTQMEELAAHVIDVDIYHTDQDKCAYNHGLFWHTYHYGDADTATHRTYPRSGAGGTSGGGPSGEHNYTTGLTLRYFLTGDFESRITVTDLGQYVIDADNGSKTIFKWLDRGETGLPSASGSFDYHGPGRGAGNSLNALLDAFRITGRRDFLDKAEQLVRRCIHPADQIAARNLLDTERKWFYTMFLQALGKYLDEKTERGELDAMYEYARMGLLHYARWMAEHEYPYLDRPDQLEFPTETWAAQDIRKSDVFYHAAKHAAGPERERFVERGEFFYTYATRTLANMPARVLARPVIILLTNGALHSWYTEHPDLTAPEPPEITDYGVPVRFVPQKTRAKRRAVALLVAATGMLASALGYLLLRVAS